MRILDSIGQNRETKLGIIISMRLLRLRARYDPFDCLSPQFDVLTSWRCRHSYSLYICFSHFAEWTLQLPHQAKRKVRFVSKRWDMSFRFSDALIIHVLFIHQFFCRFHFSRALVSCRQMGNISEKRKKEGTARQREGGSVEQHWLFMESEGIHVVQDHASCIGMGTNLSDE